MAVASLILGIVSIVFSFIPAFNVIGLILGIVGLVLAIVAKNKAPSGMATAGLICSIVGIALTLIMLVACAACFGELV